MNYFEKIPKKTSEGITYLLSGISSTHLSKGIKVISSPESSRQIDSLPRIISRNDIRNKLLALEKKYNKSSDNFYSDWKQGKAIDNLDTLKWATYYEMWKEKHFM